MLLSVIVYFARHVRAVREEWVRKGGEGKEELDRASRRFFSTVYAFSPIFASLTKYVVTPLSTPYSLRETVANQGIVLFNSSFGSLPLANSARSHATSIPDLPGCSSAAVVPISACYKVSKQLLLWLDPKLSPISQRVEQMRSRTGRL